MKAEEAGVVAGRLEELAGLDRPLNDNERETLQAAAIWVRVTANQFLENKHLIDRHDDFSERHNALIARFENLQRIHQELITHLRAMATAFEVKPDPEDQSAHGFGEVAGGSATVGIDTSRFWTTATEDSL